MFRTYEPAVDRLVAVKAFRLDLTPEQAHALADDLQQVANAGLDHPSIVRPLAAGVEGTIAYAAAEYVAAESLDVALRHYAPAGPEMVLPFITQLAGSIDFARAAGVGHGALHPRDIFVTPYEARATGFGVVQALERLGVRAPVRRPYTAPERVDGGAWDATADVYSLGAIAFELFTGRRPVGAAVDSLGSTAGPHAEALARTISRALAENPADRYPSALAFAAALEASSRGESTTAAIDQVRAMASATAAEASAATAHVPEGPHDLTVDLEQEDADVHAERDADMAEIQLRREEAGAAAFHEEAEEPEPEAERERPASARDEPPVESPVGEPTPEYRPEAPFRVVEGPPHSDFDLSAHEREEPRPSLFDLDRETENVIPEVQHPGFDAGSEEPGWDLRRPRDLAPDTAGQAVRQAREPRAPDEGTAREPPLPPRGVRDWEGTRAQVAAGRRSRSVVLPVAITLLLGLFVGFLAGYLVGARDTTGTSTATRETTPAASDAPAAATDARQPRADDRGGSAGAGAARVPAPQPPASAATPATRPPRARAPAPATVPARGRLMVRSTPAGAQVIVNGRRRGTTPLAVRDLAPGTYTVRIARDGFEEASQRVTVRGSAVREVNLRLTRRQAAASRTVFSGGLYVDSRPRGARVFLDGKEVGTTPMQLGDIRAGTHVVRLELADHRTWTSSTRVVSGEVARVTGSLERLR